MSDEIVEVKNTSIVFKWMVIFVMISTFLYHGEPDIHDSIKNVIDTIPVWMV